MLKAEGGRRTPDGSAPEDDQWGAIDTFHAGNRLMGLTSHHAEGDVEKGQSR